MVKKYNRIEAVRYAKRWALSANPNYYHFEGIGGDCTNYISQCLYAGGAVMNYNKQNGWYYISSYSRAPSWTSVIALANFLLNNKGVGPFAHVEKIENLEVGDIIQLRQNPTHFNHTVIITQIQGNQIYVCAHSNDALNKPLSSYYYVELRGIKIDGVRV